MMDHMEDSIVSPRPRVSKSEKAPRTYIKVKSKVLFKAIVKATVVKATALEPPHAPTATKCELCNKVVHKSKLELHIKSHIRVLSHTISCVICNETFSNRKSLALHHRTHVSQAPHQCKFCNKLFNRVSRLSTHVKSHTKFKPHQCELCKKTFAEMSKARQHMMIHTKEKPHICIICNRAFSLKHNLNLHIRTHTDDRRFSCNLCGKKFIQSGNLKHHKRIHKEQECQRCKEKFTIITAYKRHIRKHWREDNMAQQLLQSEIKVEPFENATPENVHVNPEFLIQHLKIQIKEEPME